MSVFVCGLPCMLHVVGLLGSACAHGCCPACCLAPSTCTCVTLLLVLLFNHISGADGGVTGAFATLPPPHACILPCSTVGGGCALVSSVLPAVLLRLLMLQYALPAHCDTVA